MDCTTVPPFYRPPSPIKSILDPDVSGSYTSLLVTLINGFKTVHLCIMHVVITASEKSLNEYLLLLLTSDYSVESVLDDVTCKQFCTRKKCQSFHIKQ